MRENVFEHEKFRLYEYVIREYIQFKISNITANERTNLPEV